MHPGPAHGLAIHGQPPQAHGRGGHGRHVRNGGRGRRFGRGRRREGLAELRQLLFERGEVIVPEGSAHSRLAGDLVAGGLQAGDQLLRM